MRIALIFEFGSLNGGELSMLAVIENVRRSAIGFTALAPPGTPLTAALENQGVLTIPFDVRNNDGQRRPKEEILVELGEKLNASKCELVHANSLAMGRLLGTIASKLPVPCIAHLRDIVKLSRAAIRDLNRNTHLIAVSEATRNFHVAQGLEADRVSVIHNGVDGDKFQPNTPEESVRGELGLSTDDFLVLTVGQIGLRKGQYVLALAAGVLEHRFPRLKYLLAGLRCSEKEESKDYETRLIARFRSLGDGDRVRILGYREDMPLLMNAADVLVHPANQEPLGRVLLEAAASGLPIVATEVGGTTEILEHNRSALLVPPGDPNALASAIQTIVPDAELRKRLAKNARERILAKFSIQAASQELLNFWMSIRDRH